MSRLSNAPRLHKGAIVSISPELPIPSVIAFQYNPKEMKRSLTPFKPTGEERSKDEQRRVERPPAETITLKAEFDATDGLEIRDPVAVSMGVYPQLSALEIMMYPPLNRVIENSFLSAGGNVEIIPPLAPLNLFVWGPARVLPVELESLSINEMAYDERLNPILAEADLTLKVLTYADLPLTDPGRYIFLAHQVTKQVMGLIGTANSVVNFF